ncbi:MAG: glycoside hydrolase family 57 [Methylococcales bacterium]
MESISINDDNNMKELFHALVLNLHQPAGNLEELLEQKEWEAREILQAIDKIPRFLWDYEDIGRVHLALSGTLLETLNSIDFQRQVYGIVDCGKLIWHLQNNKIIDILGTGYYHPVLPLIPEADREEQMQRWLGISRHLFWREQFEGFWPPEMGFSMELIPLLKQMGYRYVMVDSENVEPLIQMSWAELRYRPHIAEWKGHQIIVIVRDRELSDAQESGMEYSWFQKEVAARTEGCDFSPLITTCTDGDNGGWFRNTTGSNFWDSFYRSLLIEARKNPAAIRPTFISEYLDRFGAHGKVFVKKAAWNTGWHHGRGFVQWTGSKRQKEALERVLETSNVVHSARWKADELGVKNPDLHYELENAFWHVLRAETSCNFYWGEEWVNRCENDLKSAWDALHRAFAIVPKVAGED